MLGTLIDIRIIIYLLDHELAAGSLAIRSLDVSYIYASWEVGYVDGSLTICNSDLLALLQLSERRVDVELSRR